VRRFSAVFGAAGSAVDSETDAAVYASDNNTIIASIIFAQFVMRDPNEVWLSGLRDSVTSPIIALMVPDSVWGSRSGRLLYQSVYVAGFMFTTGLPPEFTALF
jgi:hypothetical protein